MEVYFFPYRVFVVNGCLLHIYNLRRKKLLVGKPSSLGNYSLITFKVKSLISHLVDTTHSVPLLFPSGVLSGFSVIQSECLFLDRLQGQGSRCFLGTLEKVFGK